MHSINRLSNRAFGFTVLILSILISGCYEDSSGNSDSNEGTPTINSTNPVTTATTVPINNSVTVTFSEPIDETTLTTESFIVKGAGEMALVGVVNLDTVSNTATFDPTDNLTPNIVYTATITTAVKTTTGKALASSYVWTFTSGATADSTAPTVSSTDPIDTATGVPINRNINVVFNESLTPASVNDASFSVTADMGATSISGIVTYKTTLVTFNPTSDLVADTLYTATVTSEITDIAGNALAVDYSWTFTTGSTVAAGPAPVNLLTAGNYVILTKTGITNVPTSAITGDIGATPITAASMDNVTCTEITGTIYGADQAYTGSGDISCFAGTAPDNTLVATAVLDMGTAYNDAANRTTPDFTELHAGNISGKTLVPGLYKWGTNVLINTDVTLSGGANDVWIFQISGDVIQAAGTSVLLIGGALPKNVFWQVGGGTGVALDTNASFKGIVLAIKGITVNTGTTVGGRLLSQTAVTLDMNTITQPAP
ncbi:ice-binding family protein [Thalassolituus oleivorans]|uniref:ice-binding family protein n=1 Tax=Thalassolituus oleivorans TaxID=187493 RepID=UPI00240A1845|nr:ice-binding family protein [Thalassolituus oleivorans]MDF1639730.1 ice-binding family protein [Thalassolituus oleivorans]